MAPISSSKKGSEVEVKDDIWSDLLSSLQTRTTSRGNKTIIMLGTPKSGKSTLISKMMDPKDTELIHSTPGVEFNYVTVRDEERESLGQIGVHSTSYKHFLPFALTKDRMNNSLVVIVLSLEKPWNLEEELLYWTSLLEEHIKTLQIDDREMAKLRQNVVDLFSSYKSPEEEKKNKDEEKKNKDEEDEVILPIPEGALISNLGIPVVVVLSKVDSMSTLQKENDFSEEHFEYIQWHLRKACLAWGAGLLYCSPRENSNTKLLLDYMSHVFYGLKFKTEPQVVDRDAIFVPIGWDSPSKIGLLSDGFVQFTQTKPFGEQIAPLPDIRQKRQMKGEDDQLFLTRMQAVLVDKQKTGSPSTAHKVIEGEAKGATKTPPPADGVLANFFNSLLTKKPGSGATSPNHSPSPPPTQNTLVPPKKALAPQLSAPQQREEHEKQALAQSRSNPEEEVVVVQAPKEKAPAKSAAKLPAAKAPAGTREKSPAKTTTKTPVKKIGVPSSIGMKKPVPKRGLPQPRK